MSDKKICSRCGEEVKMAPEGIQVCGDCLLKEYNKARKDLVTTEKIFWLINNCFYVRTIKGVSITVYVDDKVNSPMKDIIVGIDVDNYEDAINTGYDWAVSVVGYNVEGK